MSTANLPGWSVPKDPDSTVPYFFSWTSWLTREDDTISTYELALDEAPDASLEIVQHSQAFGVITVWLRGGTVGQRYLVRCRVTTTGGRIEDASRWLTVAEK